MKKKIGIIFFVFSNLFSYAQQPLQSLDLGVSGAIENNTSNVSLSVSHHKQLKKFQVYYGLRFNNIFNSTMMFDVDQPSVRMSQNTTSYTSANNIYIGLNWNFIGGFSFGLNTDIAGFSFGSNQHSYYNLYLDSTGFPNYKNLVQTKPVTNNLWMFSNSLGSINQEIYVEYLSENRWKMRGGLSHLTAEMIASGGGLAQEKNVQNDFPLFFLNVSYQIWKK